MSFHPVIFLHPVLERKAEAGQKAHDEHCRRGGSGIAIPIMMMSMTKRSLGHEYRCSWLEVLNLGVVGLIVLILVRGCQTVQFGLYISIWVELSGIQKKAKVMS